MGDSALDVTSQSKDPVISASKIVNLSNCSATDVGEVVSRIEYENTLCEKLTHPGAAAAARKVDSVTSHDPGFVNLKHKLLDNNTTKVMDKVHSFLAEEVGHPFSNQPRQKTTLERHNEIKEMAVTLNCDKWERKINRCKSILMVRKTLNKLRMSVAPRFKIRGLLKTVKAINVLSTKSHTCDISGAKQQAIKLIGKLKKNGLCKVTNESGQETQPVTLT